MRVLIVSPVSLGRSRQIGGTRTYTLGLVRALRAHGVDVRLAGLRGCDEGVGRGVVIADRESCGTLRFLCGLFPRISQCCRLCPDVISIQLGIAGLPFLLTKTPMVVTMHGSPRRGVAARRGRFAAFVMVCLEALVLRRARRVIFVDERACQEYVGKFPWLAEKSVVIPVGVDTDIFLPFNPEQKRSQKVAVGLPAEGPVLVFAGRFSLEKNVGSLLEAFASFRSKKPDAVLLLIGDGPEHLALVERVAILGLDKAVRFLRGLSREEIACYLGVSTLFVLASRHEGLPTAVLEAFACGVPVVSTDVGDMRRLVSPQVTGEVVADVSELTAAMQRAIGTPSRPGWAATASSACRAEALKYGWQRFADRIIDEYARAAGCGKV